MAGGVWSVEVLRDPKGVSKSFPRLASGLHDLHVHSLPISPKPIRLLLLGSGPDPSAPQAIP